MIFVKTVIKFYTMKIKWNWGTGILIAIIAMMSFVGFMVYKSTDYKINKVSDDYYERGLNHTEQMNREKNSTPYISGFEVINEHQCTVVFPAFFKNKNAQGEILFFRPSDFEQDISFDIELDTSGQQSFSFDHFKRGKYIVKATFESEGVSYYFEKDIFFN